MLKSSRPPEPMLNRRGPPGRPEIAGDARGLELEAIEVNLHKNLCGKKSPVGHSTLALRNRYA